MQRYDIIFYLAHNFTTKSLNLIKIIYLYIFIYRKTDNFVTSGYHLPLHKINRN